MGQADVLDFLEGQRKENDKWFSIPEIRENLKEKGFQGKALLNVYANVYKLCAYKLVEIKKQGVWQRELYFRYKK